MTHEIYVYILIMSAVTLAIKILPLTLIRGEIKNIFVRSFLHYVPYVTLAVMTFPAIVQATQSPVAGALALAGLLIRESLAVSLLGAVLGIAAGFLLTGAFSTVLESALGLPFLMPGTGVKATLALGTLAICLVAGPLASAWAAGRVSRVDAGLILREG